MGKPKIEARWVCSTCGYCAPNHVDEFVESFKHQHVVTEVFTRYDTLHAIREALHDACIPGEQLESRAEFVIKELTRST